MLRLRHLPGAALAASLLVSATVTGFSQDIPEADAALRAEMAAITLQRDSLPNGYIFSGETFLTADQVASGEVSPQELTDAGFVSQYLSVYRDPDSGTQISSYVSAWTDADAATAGFDLLEDESRTNPASTFEDSDAGVGEAPGETTTGSSPDPSDASVTVSSVDTTFRMDRFLVGTSLQTANGTPPDPAIVTGLAGAIEARATAAVAGDNPEGTRLALPPQALPLFAISPSLQTGFLGPQEVEQMYGLQGSALGTLTSSWTDAIALSDGSAAPYLAVGLTEFATPEDAQSVINQFSDLTPNIAGAELVEGFELEGATASVGFIFPGATTGSETADSFRIAAIVESTLIVIDVQGAPSTEVAEAAAVDLASHQLDCIGQTTCAVPTLPSELTGN
ncbi:MAG TPA: hypothetical protein VEW66_03355 [Thermomicrobiales bacterium]|nr:hypothetical protein [Thermomicrobiales bacterium]